MLAELSIGLQGLFWVIERPDLALLIWVQTEVPFVTFANIKCVRFRAFRVCIALNGAAARILGAFAGRPLGRVLAL